MDGLSKEGFYMVTAIKTRLPLILEPEPTLNLIDHTVRHDQTVPFYVSIDNGVLTG